MPPMLPMRRAEPETQIKLDGPVLSVGQFVETAKGFERAQARVDGDYDCDARRLVDLVRASAIFEKPTGAYTLESMMAQGSD